MGTPVAYSTEAVCIAVLAPTRRYALQLKFVPDVLPEALGRPGVEGRIILRWISRNWVGVGHGLN